MHNWRHHGCFALDAMVVLVVLVVLVVVVAAGEAFGGC